MWKVDEILYFFNYFYKQIKKIELIKFTFDNYLSRDKYYLFSFDNNYFQLLIIYFYEKVQNPVIMLICS